MQDNVAVVLQNPGFGFAAFDTNPRTAAPFLHQLFDFFGDGSHLSTARGRRDDEEIRDGRDRSQIENEGVFALQFCAGLCGQTGEFAAGLLTFGECRCGGFRASSDGDVSESLRLNGKVQKRKPANLAREAKPSQNVIRRRCSRVNRRAAR